MISLFPQLFAYQLAALTALRLILGLIFMGHGYSKVFKARQSTADFFNSIGIKPGKFWGMFIGITELTISALFIIGFLTQPAAIIAAIIMCVAIIKVSFKRGFLGGYELDLLILTAALVLLFFGPGVFAIDLSL